MTACIKCGSGTETLQLAATSPEDCGGAIIRTPGPCERANNIYIHIYIYIYQNCCYAKISGNGNVT